MFQIIVFLKKIERIRLDALQSSHAEKKKNKECIYAYIYVFIGPIRKYAEDGKIPAKIK